MQRNGKTWENPSKPLKPGTWISTSIPSKLCGFPRLNLVLRTWLPTSVFHGKSQIRSGLEAQFLYQEYCRGSGKDKRLELQTKLLEYNRDDIEALVGVAEGLMALMGQQNTGK